ncbi:MAG: type II toxin-antitoxin system VapC family toxin [Terriglobia bacterium]
MKPVLVDTGVIVALVDRSERYHLRCAAMMEGFERPLVTCEAVIAESSYLLRGLPGASEVVLQNVERGVFQIPFQLSRSAAPVRTIMRKYRDLPADFADACLIHLAEELNTEDILTLDGDFRLYRWRRNRPFHLLLTLD